MKNDMACTDIRSFAEIVSRAVSEELGEGCQVKLQEVMKNNGVILQGLVILAGTQNLSPTIYLNGFLEAYEAGVPLVRIVERILEIYERDMPGDSVNMDFFREFARVRERICYRVINRERNRVLLEHIPHLDFLDLSICFFYAYEGPVIGAGSILIYNSHMEMWNSSTVELLCLAQENTMRIFPWELQNLGKLLAGYTRQAESEEIPMQVLSNRQRVHGAACMIYPGVLSMAAQRAKENLYILPSSIHEVLLLPESEAGDVQSIKNMIREVNRTQVEPEEILSDNLYIYRPSENRVEVVQR